MSTARHGALGTIHNSEQRRDMSVAEKDIVLYTPAHAAELLAVKESWLRRKAGERAIPCTFLGKHLRFSTHDLQAIAHLGAQPAITRRSRRGARPLNG